METADLILTPPSENGQSVEESFDYEAIKLPARDLTNIDVTATVTKISVRKPHNQWFVRVKNDPAYHIDVALFEFEETERETFIVHPKMFPYLANENGFKPSTLFTSITRQGVLFLWKIPHPNKEGKLHEWHQSALVAMNKARHEWVRVKSNMQLGGYELLSTDVKIPDPVWPDLSPRQILKIAARGYLIDSVDHPVIKKLRGEG
jgi:hypothetical protein